MAFKRQVLFILFMCIGMGGSMSWLKLATNQGINSSMWRVFLISVLPTIAFAFVFNFLIVSNISNWLVKLLTKNITDEKVIGLKAGAIRGWTMLIMMSFTMSTRALWISGTLSHMTVVQFILGYFGTLTMAYFVRDVVIMPLVRRILFRPVV